MHRELSERERVVAGAACLAARRLSGQPRPKRARVLDDVLDEREAPRASVETVDAMEAREVARELVEVVERPVVELTV